MNRFLYKYMPLRVEFFEEPMVRATPVTVLNDPFEGIFNDKQIKDADRNQTDFYQENGKDVREFDDFELNEIAGNFQMDIQDLGVIALTEDYNNHLMWSHYADEHSGVVVEFDFSKPFFMDSINEFNGRPSRFGKAYLGDIFEFPEKVDYRSMMPDFSRRELSAPEDMFEYHWNKFNRAIFFTKSDDWIYEKEQRIVIPLRKADSIISRDDEYVRRICTNHPEIGLKVLPQDKLLITFPLGYEMHEEMGDESIKDELYRATNDVQEPAIHLFRINPDAISGVYFGCRCKYSPAVDKVRSNTSLKKLDHIYKMERDNYFYRFNKRKIES